MISYHTCHNTTLYDVIDVVLSVRNSFIWYAFTTVRRLFTKYELTYEQNMWTTGSKHLKFWDLIWLTCGVKFTHSLTKRTHEHHLHYAADVRARWFTDYELKVLEFMIVGRVLSHTRTAMKMCIVRRQSISLFMFLKICIYPSITLRSYLVNNHIITSRVIVKDIYVFPVYLHISPKCTKSGI